MATPTLSSLLHHNGPTFNVPPHDYEAFTYVSSGASNDDLVETVKYYQGGSGGTLVATVTFAYVGSTNNVASATLTV